MSRPAARAHTHCSGAPPPAAAALAGMCASALRRCTRPRADINGIDQRARSEHSSPHRQLPTDPAAGPHCECPRSRRCRNSPTALRSRLRPSLALRHAHPSAHTRAACVCLCVREITRCVKTCWTHMYIGPTATQLYTGLSDGNRRRPDVRDMCQNMHESRPCLDPCT